MYFLGGFNFESCGFGISALFSWKDILSSQESASRKRGGKTVNISLSGGDQHELWIISFWQYLPKVTCHWTRTGKHDVLYSVMRSSSDLSVSVNKAWWRFQICYARLKHSELSLLQSSRAIILINVWFACMATCWLSSEYSGLLDCEAGYLSCLGFQ